MLFENKNREDQNYKTHVESDFEYLDRSGRIDAQRVREFLNEWIGRFPESEAIELITRITSKDRRAFDSATFEIVLYAIISSLGGILEVHPELENGSKKHPDFLVHMPSGDEFYLEAVLASDFSQAEKAAERRKNVVLEAIEKLDSPNFFIGISAKGNPDTPPRGKALRRELARWLEGLDPDKVAKEVNGHNLNRFPTLVWEHDGWNVEFKAIPIKPERRGKGQRVIGVQFNGARRSNKWEPIRDAVRSKGGRYGELAKPFIVAVNVDSGFLESIDEMQALFGQEEFVFSRTNPDAEPKMRRAPNGAWSGPNGPQYTRVSGVWIFDSINPWNIASRKNTLYVNPWTLLPIPESLLVINHAMVNNEIMEWSEGERLSTVLGLSEDWPEY
jgi:hypothetical protein